MADRPKPGDTIPGTDGEYFRYKSVFMTPPTDADRVRALNMSAPIRCKACELIMTSVSKKAKRLTEDDIMDVVFEDFFLFFITRNPCYSLFPISLFVVSI